MIRTEKFDIQELRSIGVRGTEVVFVMYETLQRIPVRRQKFPLKRYITFISIIILINMTIRKFFRLV